MKLKNNSIVYAVKNILTYSPKYFLLFIPYIILGGLFPVSLTYLNQYLIKTLTNPAYPAFLYDAAILILSILLIKLCRKISDIVFSLTNKKISNHINQDIKLNIIEKLQKIQLKNFNNPTTYDVIERASQTNSSYITEPLFMFVNLLRELISIVWYVVLLLKFDVFLFAAVLILVLPSKKIQNAILNVIIKTENKLTNLLRKARYYKNSMLDISVDIASEIRLYGLSDFFKQKYIEVDNQYIKEKKSGELKVHLLSFLFSAYFYLIQYGAIIYLILKVIYQHMSLDSYVLYSSCIMSFQAFLLSSMDKYKLNAENKIRLNYYEEFKQLEDDYDLKDYDVAESILTLREEEPLIRFENVSFAYDRASSEFSIKNLNFSIEKGEKVAIVGENGSGKTTLVNLLSGIYTPHSGKIYLHGTHLNTIPRELLYKSFQYMPQVNHKLALKIKDFITLNEHEDKLKYRRALHTSRVDELLANLHDDTMLTNELEADGYEPSVGQWQRLFLARADYKDADICIYDEPSASLDVKTQYEFVENLMKQNKTVIMISHTLMEVIHFDKIIYLDHGK
ncbi:MAG: ABC transporter ATP-binding protein, partial [Clostridiales bacterium]|nr:ABC transporter ATP-binding protein [Clostridiales bacterium]